MTAVSALLVLLLTGGLSPEQSRELVDRYNQAQSAIGQGDYVTASASLGALVRDFGSSEFGDELRYAQAETYFNLGRYSRAADIFNRLLERPHYSYIRAEAMYGMAVSQVMMGDLKRARLTLEKLSKEEGYDRDDRANFALGVLYYSLTNYDQAIAKLSGVGLPEAKFYLGKAYAKTGKPLPALLKLCDELHEWGRPLMVDSKYVCPISSITVNLGKIDSVSRIPDRLEVEFLCTTREMLKSTHWDESIFRKIKEQKLSLLRLFQNTGEVRPNELIIYVRAPSYVIGQPDN